MPTKNRFQPAWRGQPPRRAADRPGPAAEAPVAGRWLLAGFLTALVLAGLLSWGPAAAENGDYSRAQVELFDSPHLDNVRKPQTLRYDFSRRGSAVEPADDDIEMTVTEILPDGGKNLSFRFLSGEREKRFPPLEGFRGNPLFMLFLEREVERLAEETGGSALYFRNRIRESFATRAEVEDLTLPVDGGAAAPARLVTLEPFVEDPMIDRFPRHRHRRYEFLLSDAVPGGIARLATILPADDAGTPPQLEETVSFREVAP